jgi:hypothetical protein
MPPKRITLTRSHGKWDDCDIGFMITMIVKQKKIKCIKCTNKGDELYDVPTYCMKFLKYDPSWHWIKGVCHIQLKNNLIEMKVQGAFNALDYYFTIAFNYNSKLVWGKMCSKGITKLKA